MYNLVFLYLLTVYAHKSLRVHEPHPVYPSPPRDWTVFPLPLFFSCFPPLPSFSILYPPLILILVLFSFLFSYHSSRPLLSWRLRCIVAVGFLSSTPYRVLSIHLLLSIPLLGPSPCHTAYSTSSGDHRVFILADSSIASSFLCPSSLFFVSILRFLAAILLGLDSGCLLSIDWYASPLLTSSTTVTSC